MESVLPLEIVEAARVDVVQRNFGHQSHRIAYHENRQGGTGDILVRDLVEQLFLPPSLILNSDKNKTIPI
jgi:hypothetical protein